MNEEIINKGLTLLQESSSVLTGGGKMLASEYIDLLKFSAVFALVKSAAWFLVPITVSKAFSLYSIGLDDDNDKKRLVAWKFLLTAGTAIGCFVYTVPKLEELGKIMVAPNVFLVKEGKEILMEFKK